MNEVCCRWVSGSPGVVKKNHDANVSSGAHIAHTPKFTNHNLIFLKAKYVVFGSSLTENGKNWGQSRNVRKMLKIIPLQYHKKNNLLVKIRGGNIKYICFAIEKGLCVWISVCVWMNECAKYSFECGTKCIVRKQETRLPSNLSRCVGLFWSLLWYTFWSSVCVNVWLTSTDSLCTLSYTSNEGFLVFG